MSPSKSTGLSSLVKVIHLSALLIRFKILINHVRKYFGSLSSCSEQSREREGLLSSYSGKALKNYFSPELGLGIQDLTGNSITENLSGKTENFSGVGRW